MLSIKRNINSLAIICQIVFTGLLYVTFSSQLAAQDRVTLQFLSFPKITNPTPVELYVGDGKSIEVEIPTNRISESYKVDRMANWALGEMAKDEEGNPKFNVFGKAPALGSETQLILVIRQGKDNESGLLLIPISSLAKNLGGGSFFFINVTKAEIAGALGDKKFALKPSKYVIVKPSPSRVDGDYKYTTTQFYYRTKIATKPFFNSTWRLNDKARSFTFFYQDPKSNKLRFHSVRDYL